MSDKNNSNGREYTVDDILAEYDSKENTETQEEEPAAEDAAELIDEAPAEQSAVTSEETVPMYDLNDGNDESFDPDSEAEKYRIKTVPVLDVAPAEKFTADVKAADPSELFKEQVRDAVDLSSVAFDDGEELEIWAPSVEITAEGEDSDEASFSEELEETEVTSEQLAAQQDFDGDADVITDDEEGDVEDSYEATDEEPASKEETAETEDNNDEAEVPQTVKDDKTTEKSTAETPQDDEKKPFWQGIIPWRGDSVFEVIRKIIFIIAIIVFIGAGIMLADTLIDSNKAVKDTAENESIIATTVATTVDSDGNTVTIAPTEDEVIAHNLDVMKYYKEISENVIGYIELEGCDIYQPVVQGEDNDYYLTRTYYDEENKGGAIFADYRCVFEEGYSSPNIVLYGHNQEDGTMFGNLKNYKQNIEFYAENPVITFNTEYGVGTYLIYGFFVTNALAKQDSNGEVFHYHDYIEAMNNEYTFRWYLDEVKERNQIISPVDVKFGDSLLCLSTCSNEFSNSRFVVFARKLREGESVEDYDFTETYFNPDARGVDWEAILSGETTTTTVPEEEITEETTEETEEETEVAETTTEAETEKTKETSKTKRVDRTKTSYVHVITTGIESDAEQVTDSDGAVVTDESGNPVTEAPVTDGNGVIVTEVPETAEAETTTETAGVTE